MCNFSCCFLCLLPLPVCYAPSRRIWLHLLCNSLSVSGKLQFGPKEDSATELSASSLTCVLQLPDHPVGFLLDSLRFQSFSYTGELETDIALQIQSQKRLCKGEGSPVMTRCERCSSCSSGCCCWFALLQGCVVGSCLACCPPGHQGPFLQKLVYRLYGYT